MKESERVLIEINRCKVVLLLLHQMHLSRAALCLFQSKINLKKINLKIIIELQDQTKYSDEKAGEATNHKVLPQPQRMLALPQFWPQNHTKTILLTLTIRKQLNYCAYNMQAKLLFCPLAFVDDCQCFS